MEDEQKNKEKSEEFLNKEEDGDFFSKEDQEKVKERLKSLGYLD